MQTPELLDRFELLYPLNTRISDLRRAYIDKDLSSIFRLLKDSEVRGDVEDLRKAVLEKNLHSIFRMTDYDDLRKLLLEDNVWKLWPILDSYIDTQFVAAFKSFFVNNIEIDDDCFSRGQLSSKIWLIKELKKLNLNLGTVYLCAGWYATLATMLFENNLRVDKIRSFDIDPSCVDIAETFNKPWFVDNWRFKSITQDIYDIDYKEHTWQFWSNLNKRMSFPITDVPDTIINTSTEHLEFFDDWYAKIPEGRLVVLQNNNYFEIKEHVNCSNSLEEFSAKAPMTKVLYEGSLDLPKYTRYMKIGIK